MKKHLNVNSVMNELTGQSAFFKPSQPQEPADQVKPSTEEREPPAPVRPVRDVRNVRNVPPQRVMKRHPFDIYRDQLETLQEMKLKHMMEGNLKSMSEMVREALDEYINQHRT